MLIEEFNSIIAKHRLHAPAGTEVRILREMGGEVQVEIMGKKVWVEKRLTKPYTPEHSRSEFEPQCSLDLDDFQLPAGPFKLLMWIRHLEQPVFSGKHAERSINMASRTVRDNLKYLELAGKISVQHFAGRGYKVTLKEENNDKAKIH
jgi:hypothetical protein